MRPGARIAARHRCHVGASIACGPLNRRVAPLGAAPDPRIGPSTDAA